MAVKVGTLIREARQSAGFTQEQLAKKVGGGLTATEISKAERGELALPVAALRKIAKATGVTQTSLVNAAAGASNAGSAKPTASQGGSLRLTATEKKLVSDYRKATSDQKKAASLVLRGKCDEHLQTLLSTATTSTGGGLQGSVADILSDALGNLLGKQ